MYNDYLNNGTGLCHVYSFGEDTPRLTTSERDMVMAVNILAYCSIVCGVEIWAFCMMGTHFHCLVKGSSEESLAFGKKFMQLFLLYLTRSRGHTEYTLKDVEISVKEVHDSGYLKNLVAYIVRNPIDSGFSLDPREYRWSSANLYFSQRHYQGRRLGDITVRDRYTLLGNHYSYPPDWTVGEDGMIEPQNFVNYKAVENLFGSIRAYIAFMHIRKDDLAALNEECMKHSIRTLSDIEMTNAANEAALRLFRRKAENLPLESRLAIARYLRKEKGAGKSQLARILNLPSSSVDLV